MIVWQTESNSMTFRKRACTPNATENVRYAVSLSNLRKMTIDHIMPLSRGGTNDIKNLQLACKRCNSMKSNMTMDDMMGQISEILKYNRKQKLIRALGGIME